MKEHVTNFDLNAAFKALDEFDYPDTKVSLKESSTRRFLNKRLTEDKYSVNDTTELEQARDSRDKDIAAAKLARIEKIVDLDAESPEDLLPTYVGKVIIQCPQCKTMFYKNAEDINRDEENPDLANIGEVCQHCGNQDGYDVVGKVAEDEQEQEQEPQPEEEETTFDLNSAEVEEPEADLNADIGAIEDEDTLEETEDTDEEVVEEESEEEEEEEDKKKEESLSNQLERVNKSLQEALSDDELISKYENELKNRLDGVAQNIEFDTLLTSGGKHGNGYVDMYFKAHAPQTEVEKALRKIDFLDKDFTVLLTDGRWRVTVSFVKSLQESLSDAFEEEPETSYDDEEYDEWYQVFDELIGSWSAIHDYKHDYKSIGLDKDMIMPYADAPDGTAMMIRIPKEVAKAWGKDKIISTLKAAKRIVVKHGGTFEKLADNYTKDIIYIADFGRDLSQTKIEEDLSANKEKIRSWARRVRKGLSESTELQEDNSDITDAEFEELLNNPAFKAANAYEEIPDVREALDKDFDVDNLEDLDECSLDKKLTEYFKNTYENVESFKTTDCSIEGKKLVVEGTILFKSGVKKTTLFEFYKRSVTKNNKFILEGYNKDFSDKKAFSIKASVKDKALVTEALKYSYKIDKDKVKGEVK